MLAARWLESSRWTLPSKRCCTLRLNANCIYYAMHACALMWHVMCLRSADEHKLYVIWRNGMPMPKCSCIFKIQTLPALLWAAAMHAYMGIAIMSPAAPRRPHLHICVLRIYAHTNVGNYVKSVTKKFGSNLPPPWRLSVIYKLCSTLRLRSNPNGCCCCDGQEVDYTFASHLGLIRCQTLMNIKVSTKHHI
jgi:hypothetical protein